MDKAEFNKYLKSADSNQYSFAKIYNEYYSKIVLHISVKFDSSIAQDVAHEFFYKLIDGKFKDVPKIEYPVAWMYRICDNMAVNICKKEARYVSISDYDFKDYNNDLDKILDIKELLDALNDFERKIIYFHFFEGYSLKEIAYMLNVKYDNFRKKYSALLKKLRKNCRLFPK